MQKELFKRITNSQEDSEGLMDIMAQLQDILIKYEDQDLEDSEEDFDKVQDMIKEQENKYSQLDLKGSIEGMIIGGGDSSFKPKKLDENFPSFFEMGIIPDVTNEINKKNSDKFFVEGTSKPFLTMDDYWASDGMDKDFDEHISARIFKKL